MHPLTPSGDALSSLAHQVVPARHDPVAGASSGTAMIATVKSSALSRALAAFLLRGLSRPPHRRHCDLALMVGP
jgi:hypothetical protein